MNFDSTRKAATCLKKILLCCNVRGYQDGCVPNQVEIYTKIFYPLPIPQQQQLTLVNLPVITVSPKKSQDFQRYNQNQNLHKLNQYIFFSFFRFPSNKQCIHSQSESDTIAITSSTTVNDAVKKHQKKEERTKYYYNFFCQDFFSLRKEDKIVRFFLVQV